MTQELIALLSLHLQEPVRGMTKFPKGEFSDLVTRIGTTDLHALPGNALYEEIVQKGMILSYKEPRTYNGQFYGYHWGIDVLSPEGTAVFAADEGIVVDSCTISNLTEEFGGETYGNYIVTTKRYGTQDIFLLYGHLAHLDHKFSEGQQIAKGEQLGVMGKAFTVENGGWPPHLHFQIAKGIEGLWAYGGLELEALTVNPEIIFRLM